MFNGSMVEWTENQVSLYRWAVYYYRIKALPDDERPPNNVIENDYRLDQWFKQKKAKEKATRMGIPDRSASTRKNQFTFGD